MITEHGLLRACPLSIPTKWPQMGCTVLPGHYSQNERHIIDERNTKCEKQEHEHKTMSNQNAKEIDRPRKKFKSRYVTIARKMHHPCLLHKGLAHTHPPPAKYLWDRNISSNEEGRA